MPINEHQTPALGQDKEEQDVMEDIESDEEAEVKFVDPELRHCDYCGSDGVCQYGPKHGDNLCSECVVEQKDSIEDSSSSSDEEEEEEESEQVEGIEEEKQEIDKSPVKTDTTLDTLNFKFVTTDVYPMEQQDSQLLFVVKTSPEGFVLHSFQYMLNWNNMGNWGPCSSLFVDPTCTDEQKEAFRTFEKHLDSLWKETKTLDTVIDALLWAGYYFVENKEQTFWNSVDRDEQTLAIIMENIHEFSNKPEYEPEKYRIRQAVY